MRWRVSSTTAVAESEGRIALINLARPTQPPVILEGVVVDLWTMLDAAYSDLRDVAAEVGLSRADVDALINELTELGLIIPG